MNVIAIFSFCFWSMESWFGRFGDRDTGSPSPAARPRVSERESSKYPQNEVKEGPEYIVIKLKKIYLNEKCNI